MTVEWKYYSQKLGWKWSKAMDGSYGLPYIAVSFYPPTVLGRQARFEDRQARCAHPILHE